jgi:outer membrane immunogenic protein
MLVRLTVLGLFAAVVSPGATFAADLPTKKTPPAVPVVASPPNWSGFYAGAFVGGLGGDFSTSQALQASGTGFGFNTGTLFGYSLESGHVVYGIEGDVATNSLSHKFAARPGLVGNKIESAYEMHGRARLGYDMGGYLPFIAGGAALDHIYQYQNNPNDFDGASRSQLGWTIGAGVDAKVNLPILGPSIVRAEYLYEGMPSAAYDLGGAPLRSSLGVNEVRVALITPVGVGWTPSPEIGAADWSGAYFGVLGGGAHQSVTTKGLGASDEMNASGGFGGLYAGHNWLFGNAMLGVEGSTMLSGVEGDGPQPGALSTHYENYLDSDFRGRVGYAFGRFLPFLAAGALWSESAQTDRSNGDYRGALAQVSALFGGGVDYMATDRVALRAEYLHGASLGTVNTHLDSEVCCSQSRSSDSFRLGIAYYLH